MAAVPIFNEFHYLTSTINTRNAGFFIWLDLGAHLDLEKTNGDGWAAEKLLVEHLRSAGVIMSTGTEYHAPKPGRFRLVFCMKEDTVREGIRR